MSLVADIRTALVDAGAGPDNALTDAMADGLADAIIGWGGGAGSTLLPIALTTDVSGILPVAHGGTGASSLPAGGLAGLTAVAAGDAASVATAETYADGIGAAAATDATTKANAAQAAAIAAAATDATTKANAAQAAAIAAAATDATTKANAAVVTAEAYSDAALLAEASAARTLTNKTINGANNTLTVRLASDVTGTLPAANQAAQTMGGDCSGSTSSCTVAKVNGIACSGTPATGAVLRATSTSAAAWGQLDLADADAITGTLPVANGGTGATSLGSDKQVLYNNAGVTAGSAVVKIDEAAQQLQVDSSALGGLPAFVVTDYENTASSGVMTLRKARGTALVPTKALAGDVLGSYNAQGYFEDAGGGFGPTFGNGFRIVAEENFTSTTQGSYLMIRTTRSGTNAPAEVFRFTGYGAMINIARVAASGSIPLLTLTAGAHTGQTASTELNDVKFDLSPVLQFAAGAMATLRSFYIRARTYAFVSASTITNAATLTIEKAPVAGTNATITNTYPFWVQAGTSRFDGGVTVGGAVIGEPGVSSPYGVHGEVVVDMNNANATLTTTQYNRAVVKVTSTANFTADRTATFPSPASDANAYWKFVRNAQAGAFNVVVSTGAGATVAIAQGKGAWLLFDNTSGVVRMSADV
jgi:hypothetical protein